MYKIVKTDQFRVYSLYRIYCRYTRSTGCFFRFGMYSLKVEHFPLHRRAASTIFSILPSLETIHFAQTTHHHDRRQSQRHPDLPCGLISFRLENTRPENTSPRKHAAMAILRCSTDSTVENVASSSPFARSFFSGKMASWRERSHRGHLVYPRDDCVASETRSP